MSRSASLFLALACVPAAAPFGCASPEPRVFDVRVEVTTTDGREPVPGAAIRLRGEPAVSTDMSGRSLLHVRGRAGDRVPVSLACPAGSETATTDSELILPGAPSASPSEGPALRFTCSAVSHEAVVLVHASGGAVSLPVKVDGVVIGQTDSLGFAHLHVRTSSRAQFEVSLDTSGNPALTPGNPTRSFQLDGADELFVFDTAFDVPTSQRKAKRPPKKPRRSPETVD